MPTIASARPALTAAAVLLVAAVGFADEPVGARFDFEEPELAGEWSTTACEAELSITRDPENVCAGRGALEMTWDAAEGRLAILTVAPVVLEDRARSLRLSVKLGHQAPVMYGVREADGSSYQGYLYTPGGVWHDLAVDLSELMLLEGSEDENGRLDVRQVNSIYVADLSNLPGEAGLSLGIEQGAQYMWLDNLELSDELAPHRSSRGPDDEAIVDDFERAPILGLPVGGPELTLVHGPGEGDESALRVGYRTDGYRWVGFVGAVGYLDVTERSRVCLRLKSEQAAPLHVVLEERDGSKYVARHQLKPSNEWRDVCIAFGEFKLDPQTKDENSTLDLDQLRVIIPVVDTTRAEVEGAEGAWTVSRVWVE